MTWCWRINYEILERIFLEREVRIKIDLRRFDRFVSHLRFSPKLANSYLAQKRALLRFDRELAQTTSPAR